MWPFRRRPRAAAPPAPAIVVHRASRTDWQSTAPMPIVQARSFGAVDAGFERTLTTRRQATFIGALGHERSPLAPRGVVSGLARPTTETGTFVQRAFDVSRSTWTSAAPDDEPPFDEPQPARSSAVVDAGGGSAPGALSAVAASTPGAVADRAVTRPPIVAQRSAPAGATPSAGPGPAADAARVSHAQAAAADTDVGAPPEAVAVPGADAAEPTIVPLTTQRTPLTTDRPATTGAATAAATGSVVPPLGQRPRPNLGEPHPTTVAPTAGASHATTAGQPTGAPVISREVLTGSDAPAARPTVAHAALPSGPSSAPSTSTSTSTSTDAAVPTASGPAPAAAPSDVAVPAPPAVPDELTSSPATSVDAADAPTIVPTLGLPHRDSPSPALSRPLGSPPATPPVTTSVTAMSVQRRTMIGRPLDAGARPPVSTPTGHRQPTAMPVDPGPPPAAAQSSPVVPTLGVQRAVDDVATPPFTARSAPDPLVEPTVAMSVSRPVAAPSTAHQPSAAAPVGLADATPPTEHGAVGSATALDGGPRTQVALLAQRPLVTTSHRSAPDGPPALARPDGDVVQRSSSARPALETSARTLPSTARSPQGTTTPPARGLRSFDVQRSVGATLPASVVRNSPSDDAGPGRRFAASPAKVETAADLGFVPAPDGLLWSVDDGADLGGDVLVQRAEDDRAGSATPSAPVEGATTTATPSVGPAAAPAGRAPGTPRSEAELLELCRALYPTLHRRICRDLLLDRERAGYRTDIRF